ncbi:DNA polymerase III subunit gamma and tau [Cellulomonas sp. C5510]|uniref:DNA polymerase III subunit gamma and tau n=1 Tax=Cellulomonas sp. C5510 TaxID=2871170 RepID=UPI001C9454FA|nr:DNA polymerase III subunit gamma and tau [Cellulomonas sp. C5510]QZN85843.1 DNA polymerase III subunit gamma and tau [Cellulomonas sp. C5510]
MTTALYRRYRPETFAEVVGQDHVTGPLRQALRTGQTNHAYLFSGPRGCGKTTSARILARCLNCVEGPTDTPCGVCESCVELARGGPGSLDVVEIDAASHGGVDDARDLRERATFAPARDRYKVFILDEAHMVSPQGFNALLKIVEEPPEHVKFIFATTEPDKVIGTIRSRTHHYPFRLVPPDVMVGYLDQLCRAEGVQVGSGVLPLVVRAGGGSVRDSLSVLDQLIAGSGPEGLDYEAAVALLGYTHASLLDDLVEAVAARDGASAFRVVERVIATGHEPRRFVEDLLERLRDLIVLAASGDAAAAVLRDVPGDQLARMQAQSAHLGAAELSRSADLVNAALTEMTGATSPRLHLELLVARLLLPALDDSAAGLGARLDRLERDGVRVGAAAAPGAGDGGSGAGPAAGARQAPGSFAPAAPVERVAVVTPAEPPPAGPAAPAGSAPARPAVEPSGTERSTAAPAAEGAPAAGPDAAVVSDGAVAPAAEPAPAAPSAPATPSAPAGAAPSTSAPASGATPDAGGDTTWPDVPAPGRRGTAGAPVDEGPVDAAEQPEAAGPDAAPVAAAPPSADAATPDPVVHDVPVAEPVAPVERPAGAPGGGDTEVLRRRWPEVLDTLGRLKKTTWVLISQNAQVVELDATTLRLGFSAPGLASAFRSGPHADLVQQAVRETLGFSVKVEPVLAGPGSAAGRPADPQGPAPAGARGGAPSAAEAAASWDAPAARSAPEPGARASHDGPGPGAAPDGPADDDPDGAPRPGGPDERPVAGQPGGVRGPASAGPSARTPGRGAGDGHPAHPAAAPGDTAGSAAGEGGAGRPRTPRDDASPGPGPAGDRAPSAPPPWDADPDDPGAPEPPPEDDWAPAPPSGADRVRAAARAAAAGGAGGAGTAQAGPRLTWADDEPSMDDPDIGSSGLSGVPLLAQMLGATVVEEPDDRTS